MTASAQTRPLGARSRRRPAVGGVAFLASSAVVHLGNYVFNVVMGRALGPSLFGDLAVIVTLLLVVTLVAGTLQTAAAKLAAEPGGADVQPWARRRAVVSGVVCAAVLAMAAPLLASFFQSASPWPFVIFGLGLPAYFAQAADRGFLQGATRFGRLALTYQAEMWTRLGGATLLVALGFGLNGAVAGLSLSFVASWLAARRPVDVAAKGARPPAGTFASLIGAAGALAIGEVLINHSDLLIVKHFAEPALAGAYGALSIVGRVPFFAAWSIAAIAFPYAARAAGPAARLRIRGVTITVVGVLGGAIAVAMWTMPSFILTTLFGGGYDVYAEFLGPYALAAAAFAVGHTVATLDLAEGRTTSAYLVTAAGVAQCAGLWWLHASIGMVVAVQVVLMAVLLATLSMRRSR